MPKPWERDYQDEEEVGPWTRYGAASSGASEYTSAADMASDIIMSALSGLRSGTESMAGMFGDVGETQRAIAEAGASYFGLSPETTSKVGTVARYAVPFPGISRSTQEIRENLTNPALGEASVPRGVPGEYARTIGEFAPAALLGPGGAGRKLALATVPALASETAGQITKDSWAEPYARFGGAMLGGYAAGRNYGRNPVSSAAKRAPSPEDLSRQTDSMYDYLRDKNIRYDADEFSRLGPRIHRKLYKKGYRPSSAPEAFGLADDITRDAAKGISPDFPDMESLRSMTGKKARTMLDATSAGAMGKARNELTDFINSTPFVSGKRISSAELKSASGEARRLAMLNIKQKTLAEVLENAPNYVAGEEAGIRNGILRLLRSNFGKKLFTKAEQDALREVAKGNKAIQTLSRFGFDIGKIHGNATFMPTLGAIGAYQAGGAVPAAALGISGTIAKFMSPRRTKKLFDMTAGAIRAGGLTNAELEAFRRAQLEAAERQLLISAIAARSAAGQ